MKRNDILSALIAQQQTIIDNLKESVERYQIASDLDEEATREPEDYSRQTEAKDMQLRFEKLLREATTDLKFLESEKEVSHESIEKGAIIRTNHNWFFVGVSLPQTKIGQELVVSFSEQAPIFHSFAKATVGTSLEIGTVHHSIEQIL